MISMTSYFQKRVLAEKEPSYKLWLSTCWLHWWAALVKGKSFLTKDGEVVENSVKNGAVRVLVGGLLATAAGLLVTLRGLITIIMQLCALPLLPGVALGIHLWTRRKLAKALCEFEAKVAAARSGVQK